MKAGKVWGETVNIWSSPFSKIDFIRLNKGGYCSRHRHDHMPNWFFVIEGRLKITVWQTNGLVDETVLHPEDMTVVEAGLDHMMTALEDTVAVEGYEPVSVNVKDIIRQNHGGAD